MKINLSGKRAFVCGSTQGIGLACARDLAEAGAAITLIARNEKKLEKIVKMLEPVEPRDHHYIVADFDHPDQLKKKLEEYLTKITNECHILVNNSGGPPPGTAFEAEEAAYLKAFNNHVICNQILVQRLARLMENAGYGRIINIISTSVKTPIPGLGVSNTIRGAVANWSKTLSAELGPKGITVNNVLPGFTETERLNDLLKKKADNAGLTFEEFSEQVRSEVPLRRFAQPSDIAHAVTFLASETASYISGTNITVDGGRTPVL